jgi:hypothetical protein
LKFVVFCYVIFPLASLKSPVLQLTKDPPEVIFYNLEVSTKRGAIQINSLSELNFQALSCEPRQAVQAIAV